MYILSRLKQDGIYKRAQAIIIGGRSCLSLLLLCNHFIVGDSSFPVRKTGVYYEVRTY